jgi:hypothetical protein
MCHVPERGKGANFKWFLGERGLAGNTGKKGCPFRKKWRDDFEG